MKMLHFSTDIAAPREKVWSTMLEDDTYRKWTSAFAEGSHYEGKWEVGSKLLFLDASGKAGMVSRVAECYPNEYVSIEHLGILRDGIEDTESAEAKSWAPAFENYRLTEIAGGTRLDVRMDSTEDMQSYFNDTWPKALKILKALAEK